MTESMVSVSLMHFIIVFLKYCLVSEVDRTNPTAQPMNTLSLLRPPHEPRTRVASTHIRQLSDCIIPKDQLQLVETLGQGTSFIIIMYSAYELCHAGEFGIVYRGLLLPAKSSTNTKPEGVAVKTLKGFNRRGFHDSISALYRTFF